MDEILSKYYALTPKQKKDVSKKFLDIINENEETRKKSGKKSVAKFKKITKLETERDTILYNKLRAWRNQTADESGLDVNTEAWQIMKNEPLMNLAFYRPADKEEFLRIEAMTEDIFENYGLQILAIIGNKPPEKKKISAVVKSRKESIPEPFEQEEEEIILPSNWFLPPNK